MSNYIRTIFILLGLITALMVCSSACNTKKKVQLMRNEDYNNTWILKLGDWISSDLERLSWQGNLDLKSYSSNLESKTYLASKFGGPSSVTIKITFMQEDLIVQDNLTAKEFDIAISWSGKDRTFSDKQSVEYSGTFCKLERNKHWKVVYDTSEESNSAVPLADRDNLAQLVAFGGIDATEYEFSVIEKSDRKEVTDLQTGIRYEYFPPTNDQLYGFVKRRGDD